MIEARTLVCKECSFRKGKCTFCSCSGKGVIEDPESRCPRNLWPDGWGSMIVGQPHEDDCRQVEVMIWDEETQSFISSREIEAEIEKASDPFYIFESSEQLVKFHKRKAKYRQSKKE